MVQQPFIYKRGTVSIADDGAGDDRLSLMKPEKGEWSEIILTEDAETDKYFSFSTGALPANKDSAAWLKVGTDVIATNGIQAMTISAGVSLVILHNQSYNDYHEAVSDFDGYYFYLIGDGDAVLTYLQSVQSENLDDLSWYADDGSGGLGTLILSSAPFYWAGQGGFLVNQFYEQVQTMYGYYINRPDIKFGTGETGILLTDLDNITYRLNGLAFNGREAWNYTGESAPNRYAALVDENDNPIADLVIWDGKNWNNDVYSATELGEGWIDATDGSVIILFTGGTNGGDLNKLFDFYFEQRKTVSDIMRYELHTPRVVNYNDGLNTYAVTQYSNKGYLLGLPSDEVDTLNSDTHIVGTFEIYNPTGSTTRVKAEFTYPRGKPYMQAIIPRTYGYLYVRLYDNFVTSPHEVENAVDYVEFTAAAGKSTVIAFLHATDSYADDVVYLEDLEDFISYKNKIAVIINIPSFANQTYIETDKTPVAADLLTGKEAWANGVKIVGEGSGDGGGYQRVSGVPDGAALLAAATNITVGEVEYMPIYILINYANTLSDTYTKTGTGVSTGADAYLFSDAPTMLEVGASVAHTWDLDEDIATVQVWKCRWVMMYAIKSGYTNTAVNFYSNYSGITSIRDTFEFIGGSNLVTSTTFPIGGTTQIYNYWLKLLDLSASTVRGNCAYACYGCSALMEIKLPDNVIAISGANAFNGLYALMKFTANGLKSVTSINFLSDTQICDISFPALTSVTSSGFLGATKHLQYFDMSNFTNTNFTSNWLSFCCWLVLPDNFNKSGTYFTQTTLTHEWLNTHLPSKVADRSSTSAGSIVLYGSNLSRVGSAALAVFAAKNWTLS